MLRKATGDGRRPLRVSAAPRCALTEEECVRDVSAPRGARKPIRQPPSRAARLVGRALAWQNRRLSGDQTPALQVLANSR